MRAGYAEGAHLTADIRKATGSSKPAASCTEFTDAPDRGIPKTLE